MRSALVMLVGLLVLAFVESPDCQTLSLFNAEVYDSVSRTDQLAYGLYKRGCGVYTSNDGCGQRPLSFRASSGYG